MDVIIQSLAKIVKTLQLYNRVISTQLGMKADTMYRGFQHFSHLDEAICGCVRACQVESGTSGACPRVAC